MDNFLDILNNFSIIDYIFIFYIIFFAFLGLNKGFVLSFIVIFKMGCCLYFSKNTFANNYTTY
jgi:uncharacterized membrane protein required for colicin V production